MARIRCFLLVPTEWVRDTLRRYAGHYLEDGTPNEHRTCPLMPGQYSYHNAEVELPDRHEPEDICHGMRVTPQDARWPVACSCGYRFAHWDEYQFVAHRLYRKVGTDERMPLHRAPVGAMWYDDWMTEDRGGKPGDLWYGPDGRCLVVRTPGGDWVVDGPSKQRPADHGWTRSGRPPEISVIPAIKLGGYHGWLTEGYLVDS